MNDEKPVPAPNSPPAETAQKKSEISVPQPKTEKRGAGSPRSSSGGVGRFLSEVFESISIQDRINFARHMAIVIKSGVPVYDGLKIIRKQTTARMLKKIIEQVMADVNNGRFLADSLARFDYLFGDFFISIIRVGESSGTLANNLVYLAQEMEKSRDLKSKIRSAMIYPVILLAATISIVTFLVIFAFPKLITVFASMSIKLPMSTIILIAVSKFLMTHGLALLLGIIAFLIAFRFLYKKIGGFRIIFNRITLYVPVLGKMIVDINLANFSRVLPLLLKSGITIVDAIRITSQTFDNLVIRRSLEKAAEEVRKGENLTEALSKYGRIFPPLVLGLVEIGESTGNLEENLVYLSEYYAQEVDIRVRNLISVLEPLIMVFMGLLVGFVAISIITPIYQVTSLGGK